MKMGQQPIPGKKSGRHFLPSIFLGEKQEVLEIIIIFSLCIWSNRRTHRVTIGNSSFPSFIVKVDC